MLIERKLAGGESHSYRIRLRSDRFLHVVADQRGIDIVLELFQPDGTQISKMDRWSNMRGTEALSAITTVPGNYRLEVRAANRDGPVGSYVLKIAALRAPSPKDAMVVAAEKAYMQGDDLSNEGTLEARGAAILKLEESLRLWHAVEDRLFEATTLIYIGVNYYESGEPQKALEYYTKGLPLWAMVKDLSGEAFTFTSIGTVYESLGELEQALDYYRKALSTAHRAHETRQEAWVLHRLGVAYFFLGEPLLALDYYHEALKLSKSLANRASQAHFLHHLGEVYTSLGETRKALQCLNPALELSRAVQDRLGEATTLNHLGTVYSSTGDQGKALVYYSKALVLRQTAGYQIGEAQTLVNIGHVYELMDEKQKALPQYEQALELCRRLGTRRDEATTLYRMAKIERDLGHLERSRTRIEAALAIIESLRRKVLTNELQISYFGSVREYYEFYVDLLMQLHRLHPAEGYNAKALEVSERSRARTLLESLIEARTDIRQGVDPQLLIEERTLQQLINAKSDRQIRLLNGKHTESQAGAAKKELETLLMHYHEVEDDIRRTSPRYAELMLPRPLSLGEIRNQVLDEETLLLEYMLGEERSYAWVVTRKELKSIVLPGREEVEAAARQVYALLTAQKLEESTELHGARPKRLAEIPREYPQALAKLSQMLLGALEPLPKGKRLLIVSDGALAYMPFSALPVRSAESANAEIPLTVEHEVISLPSASVLAVLRQEVGERKAAPKTVAVLADPVFDREDERVQMGARPKRQRGVPPLSTSEVAGNSLNPGLTSLAASIATLGWTQSTAELGLRKTRLRFSRLVFTRQEAAAILALTPEGEGMMALDFRASRETATSGELAQYRIVHFATHAVFDSTHPASSGLVLSLVDKNGNRQNGFLELQDIYNLTLPADLVVLSACETGLGKEVKGEGLLGLTRGFMYAGAARVVASLWKVDDVATAELMRRFYKAMLKEGLRPAAALREAQIEMWKQKRWTAPYYWGAFVLQGEWN